MEVSDVLSFRQRKWSDYKREKELDTFSCASLTFLSPYFSHDYFISVSLHTLPSSLSAWEPRSVLG